MNPDSPRPSRAWVVAMVATLVVAAIMALGAVIIQTRANRPIGEGRLFHAEASAAAASLGSMPGAPIDQLRRVRNSLEIEAIARVDGDGTITEATSDSLIGESITNSFLAFAHTEQRFGAVAVTAPGSIFIDGVEEWPAQSAFYAVMQPLGDGSSLLFYYDISELLQRRDQAAGFSSAAIRLASAAAAFLAAAVGLAYSRSKSLRRFREFELENRILRDHAEALETRNRIIDEARAEAERAQQEAEMAYALADEKSRVRAEFVLMINHELRTPLTAVVTGAEVLSTTEGLTDADRQQITDDMLFNGRRLQEIISQMLAVARMENRGLTVSMSPRSGGELLELAEQAHPRLSMGSGFNELGGEVVFTDRATLSHLIGSLVDNAYTHGARSVSIGASLELERLPQVTVGDLPDEPLYLTITDDGPGIDPSFLPRAFEKYEKASFSSGTGLGLYAAQLMADAIDASLSISTSRLGTSLIIGLPRTGRLAGLAL